MKNPAAKWAPTMEDYHAAPGYSASFVSAVRREGYGCVALARNGSDGKLEENATLLCGELLHCQLQRLTHRIHIAPPGVTSRRGKDWRHEKKRGHGMRGVLLYTDLLRVNTSIMSLRGCPVTPAKEQIRLIVGGERLERWPELSHRWEPIPDIACKVRPDFVLRWKDANGGRLDGRLAQAPIKSTRASLVPQAWWPFWERWHLCSAAFHWAGMCDLFGQEVPQLWIVAQLDGAFPWALHEISSGTDSGRGYLRGGRTAQEAIEREWERILLELVDIKEARENGYGAEEKGIGQ